jgi:protein transport protein SEC20
LGYFSLSHFADESTASLKSTSTTHDTLTNIMGTSKQLITALEKSDWMDRLLILFGLFVFFMVVLFILKQRILDRGIRVALWWTKFIPDFSGDEELIRMEKGRDDYLSLSSMAAATLSSVVASATTTALAISTSLSSEVPPGPLPVEDVEESQLLSSVVSSSIPPSTSPVDSERTTDTSSHDEL